MSTPRRGKVTEAMLAVILAAPETISDARLGRELGVSGATIGRHRRHDVQRVSAHRQYRRWTNEEVEYLLNHPRDSAIEIGEALDRPIFGVRWQRQQFRLAGTIGVSEPDAIRLAAAGQAKIRADAAIIHCSISSSAVAKLVELQVATGLRRSEIVRLLIDDASAERVRVLWERLTKPEE